MFIQRLKQNINAFIILFFFCLFIVSALFVSNAVSSKTFITVPISQANKHLAENESLIVGDFNVRAFPTSRNISRGETASFTITISSVSGFNSPVSLTAHNLPGQVLSGTGFLPQVVTPDPNGSKDSTLNIVTNNQTPTGLFIITIKGTSGSIVRETTINLTIVAPDFSVSASPTVSSVKRGGIAEFNVTIRSINSFNSSVNLSALNLPGNQVLSGTGFTPNTVTPQANNQTTSVFRFYTNSQTPLGTFTITIQGVSGNLTRNTTVNLNVAQTGDFNVSASPNSLSITQGESAAFTIGVNSLQGFSDSVSLSALNLPSGYVATGTGFSPQTVTPSSNNTANSTLTIKTNNQTQTGTFTITINGKSTSYSRDTTITLTINSAPTDAMALISTSPAETDSPLPTNQLFNTTWRIKNTGNTTWTNYTAEWLQGQVEGLPSTNLTSPLKVGSGVLNTITPGNDLLLTISMIAPATPGTYFMYWQMKNSNNVFFGTPFRLRIVVYDNGEALFGLDREDFGNEDSPGSNAGINDDSLNTATGNFNYLVTDLNVASRGMNFIFSRSYNSQDKTGGPLGIGWSHSYNIYLLFNNEHPEVVTVHYADGKRLTFIDKTGGNLYTPAAKGYYDAIVKHPDNSWSLIKSDLREFRFNNLGYLQFIQDRNNNRTTLTYNGFNSIGKITDTVGREYVFTYTNFLLTQVTDPIGRTLQFEYTNGKLTVFKDARLNPHTYSYDAAGRLNEVTDGRGIKIMTNTYDNDERLISQRNGRGSLWKFSYETATKITYVTDPNSKQITYKHDAENKLLSFTKRLAQSNTTAIGYDSKNNRTSVTDPLGIPYSYTYTDKGNIKESKDVNQNKRTFIYEDPYNPTSPTFITDELQNPTSFGYDQRGNLLTISNALNNATRITYNEFGQPITIVDPYLNETKLSYDIQGNLKNVTNAENNVTTFNYDGISRRTSVTNARGKTTIFSYDNNDNIQAIQRPIGGDLYGYDGANNLISKTDAKLNLITYEYDQNNNLIKEIDPTRNFYKQHTYDSLDRRIATRDKRGNTTNFEYDEEGRLLSVTEPEPFQNKTKFTYDGNGNRLTITDANNQTTKFTYDELNRLTVIEDPLGNKIRKDYDAAGKPIKETDGRLNITRYTYDKVNNLTQIDDAEDGITKYEYDKNNNLIRQFDPVKLGETNKISKFIYDKTNRLISSEDPLGNIYSYTYDGVGNRLTQKDAKQQLISFSYDDNGRLATITYPGNSVTRFFYDPNGNLIRMEDPRGISIYTYDSQNRLLTYKDVYDKTISYSYDPNSNISVITYPDGKQVQYEYDSNNRMISLTDWGGRKVSYEYTPLNQLKKITPPITSSNGATTYSYDLAGRLTGMVNAHTQGPNNTYSFVLDANGNRTSISTQEPLNNRVAATSQNYTYDAANRIQSAGSDTFAFDNNGNMKSKIQNGVTTNYYYDANDRLLGDAENVYYYNGLGVRVAKIVQASLIRYVVDINQELSQVLCETDRNGNITSYYVYGQGLVYQVLPDGTHYYYQFDPNGSTVSMTTENDVYVKKYAYDPFGKITNSVENNPNSSTNVWNPFKFGGRFGMMDEGNGLVYARARYYSPELGRFLNKDPLRGDLKDGQSLNRFIYALNNPINMFDANGMKPEFTSKQKSFLEDSIVAISSDIVNKYIDNLGSAASIAYGPAMEVYTIRNNPDLSKLHWSERLARVYFRLGDSALSAAAGAACGPVGLACSLALDSYADETFEKRFAKVKRDVDPLGGWIYNNLMTKPEETAEYKRNQESLNQAQQKQQNNKVYGPPAPNNKVYVRPLPKSPPNTKMSLTAPKPAPLTCRVGNAVFGSRYSGGGGGGGGGSSW